MGVFSRPDSKYWQLYLETIHHKEATDIVIGTTAAQRADSRRLADDRYHQRMSELAARLYRLPSAKRKLITFDAFATWYDEHVIAHHKGHEREREILRTLRRGFGFCLLDDIDPARVTTWRTIRLRTPTLVEHFGGRKTVAMWARIHAFLREHGPQPVKQIREAFRLTPRQATRSFVKSYTAQYFERSRDGIWTAVGNPSHRTARLLPPPSARTVNREVDLLQQMLAAAVPAYLDSSPLEGFADLAFTEPVRRTMSVAEEQRILEQLECDDRAIVLIGLDTLTRLGDILDLKRSDDHGTYLTIRDPKNGLPHTAPVSTRVRLALDTLPVPDRPDAYFFARRRRAQTERDRRNAVAKALKRACEAAHVPYGRARAGITFHWATRRTGATRMIRAGGERSVGTTQRIGNWKDPRVLIDIYQETITDDMRAAVESVSQATDPVPVPETFPSQAKQARIPRKSA